MDIQDKQIDLVVGCEVLPPDGTPGGMQGGFVCTGFIDVEKVIKIICPGDPGQATIWFLEKKLPFQVLVKRLPDQSFIPPA